MGSLISLLIASSLAFGNTELKSAVFAGGCFWCMEPPFEKLEGVVAAESGYTGGTDPKPTYESVSGGKTGHYEAVRVTYDPRKVTYETLLATFWKNIDPTDAAGQFCDKGDHYRAAIFVSGPSERDAATKSRESVIKSLNIKKPIVTEVIDFKSFHLAEEYHQDYAKKNPIRYKYYRSGCRRDSRLKELWGETP